MASFQAKIGSKRMRQRENENYHYVSFLPDAKFKIPTKQQKIQKIKKYYYGFMLSQNRLEKAEKERK